ncbi:MAG TPA: hypothetical protein VGF70_04460 [Solirubrobacteraceae bacterium]|jgi:pimeloyl-ACP methyl ester carboxylesterase
MPSALALGDAVASPLRGELRYGLELARLTADREFVLPRRQPNAPPVLLVPGFMAGDRSLSVLRGWLGRRGSPTAGSGIRFNADCGERAAVRVEMRLRRLVNRTGRRAVIVGQSRGGELARVVTVRNPDLVSAVVMLGSPVRARLDVGPSVLNAVRSVARLGDLGIPGLFSSQCAEGDCCAAYRQDLNRPLPASVEAVAVYSRTDGIVSWPACLDPDARHIEVKSSHTGMSVNRDVYRALADVLEAQEES